MKTTDRKTLRPTAGADRPGDAPSAEPRIFVLRRLPERPGLFTGGATLH